MVADATLKHPFNPAAPEEALHSMLAPEIRQPVRSERPSTLAAYSRIMQALSLIGLTFVSMLVNGYHPNAEDAGVYIPGIKLLLDPTLYPHSRAFVVEYSHLSIFAHLIAALVHILHLGLAPVLFSLYLFTTGLLVFACWQMACRAFSSPPARFAGVMLVTLCACVPVAGSALYMSDPYLTSRSFSTPLTILAVCALLDRRVFRSLAYLALVLLFHPLMSIYTAGFLLMLWAVQSRSKPAVLTLFALALLAGLAITLAKRSSTETLDYRAAVLTRQYFYLSQWHWYEWIGLICPIAILAAYAYLQRSSRDPERRGGAVLAATAAIVGSLSIAVCLLYAQPDSHSHLVATLQPIRTFHLLFFIMFTLLGGVLQQFLLLQKPWRWLLFFYPLAISLFLVQHLGTYPASPQVEFPWSTSTNPWNQAFHWIRANTPTDAIVAFDPNYIGANQEDAQGFRAIGERSSLADYSKDGGAAAVFPTLAGQWMREHTATSGLNTLTDPQRIARMRPFGVHWMVLPATAPTQLPCPYRNPSVQVCTLP